MTVVDVPVETIIRGIPTSPPRYTWFSPASATSACVSCRPDGGTDLVL
jgi:hypothetical protein